MPERVRAPQRGLASMGAVFRLWLPRSTCGPDAPVLFLGARWIVGQIVRLVGLAVTPAV